MEISVGDGKESLTFPLIDQRLLAVSYIFD